MSLQGIQSDYDLAKINKTFTSCHSVSESEITSRMSELREKPLHSNLRGKYVFDFLISFMRLLIEDANTKGKKIYLTKKVKFNIDHKTALSTLSSYAETPMCLKNFISQLN